MELYRKLLCLLLVFLPSPIKIYIYNKFLGCDIHKTAKIGMSYICVRKIKMGAGARIRHLNIIKNLELLELGEVASIGNMNSITAVPSLSRMHFKNEKDRYPALIMGEHSAIVKKHFFDCNNTISIGKYATIAGLGSVFFTHGINLEDNRQELNKIKIGDYSMVSACSVITKGAVLPDCSILGANSTLHKAFSQSHTLYSGVPAQAVKKLDANFKYFHREVGYVE
ncbi:MAG: hypothetical protein COA45_12025 [Zetaproteobacteria bacterium]|nr:MAG: hypothetical protein COA45_12025 [Zetaproteobacteria bacterium]